MGVSSLNRNIKINFPNTLQYSYKSISLTDINQGGAINKSSFMKKARLLFLKISLTGVKGGDVL